MLLNNYNREEQWLYEKPYLFIKGYATGRNFQNTLRALPLARCVHNGQYRHGLVEVEGKEVQLPYFVHCLKVTSTIMALNLPLTDFELDVLYATALLHDTLEDGSSFFPKGGTEFMTEYGLHQSVFENVRLLSKRSGATEAELRNYFQAIQRNKLTLIVKLSDRSHNVEDLYNMKNIEKYNRETRMFFLDRGGICTYGKDHYPELSNGITLLKSKILSLTETSEFLVKHLKKEAESICEP